MASALNHCSDPGERVRCALDLLCSLDETAQGHLFLLTRHGLALAGSSVPPRDAEQLQGFARSFLELELELEDDGTMTAARALTAVQSSTERSLFCAADGAKYAALALRARIDGREHIAGVVLLSCGTQAWPSQLLEVACAIAKHMIGAGDVVSLQIG